MDEGTVTNEPETDVPSPLPTTREEYRAALKAFDACVCEALAVGQAIGQQVAAPHHGYGTHVFTRICANAVALVRAAPKSRWVRSDADFWDLTAVAGHARSLMEGLLLLHYVLKTPTDQDEWSARINLMHLNDCCRRSKILGATSSEAQVKEFADVAEGLRDRLRGNAYFQGLDHRVRERLLKGDALTIPTRNELLDELEIDKEPFHMVWNLLSQYAHVLPMSFYRIEANGRGSGLENDTDRSYIRLALEVGATYVATAVDLIVEAFPDAAEARKGLDSKFSPGPARNVPRERHRRRS
ncbi:hypothetical protein PMNALOAF_2242 [Methylobacterium adhaesivum]|uniref:Uncharacterized protein n=1 Tax=Methylobacterium adhaesivum TaxID=333297 RepID=A0ABT8BND5_9HYPH|nr:hypothetical protein [Methylobacterium adhaesivum]MDN3593047.1 hypothetical protein [Methylobacterium adhaesivum]GJD30990.1 hypothetical protein PMNALOAF_2242 [Methylobacterium adhaesivum]